MTALEFATNFVLKTLEQNRSILEDKLPEACSCKNWNDVIKKIKSNHNDIVEWVFSEVFAGHVGDFKISEFATSENISGNDYYMEFVYPVEGKNILIRYSDRHAFVWTKVEFFLVEEEEILIPKKIWKIVEN